MAIYDCFQYFNEDHMVDLRLNILDEYVDYFVISESTKTHQGKDKSLNFNIENFKKFKHKIIYTIADFQNEKEVINHTGGESIVEQHQRNNILNGLNKASDNDLIILSDSDEIPDFKKIGQIKSTTKFTAFSQKMFMYKLNLQNLDESGWIGSKICRKKNLPKPQKLRDLKFKQYPFWRLDKRNLQIIKGGWHFSFLQNAKDIANKIQSFSHGEFNTIDNTNIKKIVQKISHGKDIFNRGYELKKIEIDDSYPDYIFKNKILLKNWIV